MNNNDVKKLMNFNFANGTKEIKFKSFVGFAIILFFFKIFFGSIDALFFHVLNEIIVILTAASFILFMSDYIRTKKINPLTLVMNIGILNAILFVLMTFSDSILGWAFGNVQQRLIKPDLLISIISYIYGFVFISSVSYIFFTFKELFFLKQKKKNKDHFRYHIQLII